MRRADERATTGATNSIGRDSGRLALELLLEPFDNHLSTTEVRLKSGAVRRVGRLIVRRCKQSLMLGLKSRVIGQEHTKFSVECG
jgi:hypothetical protein